MRTAVVFYGSMRELEIGSKSWHILGEDVDYFLVTWDRVNLHGTYPVESYPFDLSTFPVTVKASIIINYEQHVASLESKGIMPAGILYILYHWSLVKHIPGIMSYDTIVITRTDTAFFNAGETRWHPPHAPGKVSFAGNDETGINDWLVVSDPTGLDTLIDIYNNALETPSIFNKDGLYKTIHYYLLDQIKANPHKFNYPFILPMQVLVRPNYPRHWVDLPYGPEFAYNIINHAIRYAQQHSVHDAKMTTESMMQQIIWK